MDGTEMFNIKKARERGRSKYIKEYNKYGNAPSVNKEYSKGSRGWSVKRKIAENIKYWEMLNDSSNKTN